MEVYIYLSALWCETCGQKIRRQRLREISIPLREFLQRIGKTGHWFAKDSEYRRVYREEICEQYGIRPTARKVMPPDFDPSDESTFDSDYLPKGAYAGSGGEADSPQHCDGCKVFLENPLTEVGYQYVRECVWDRYFNPGRPQAVVHIWEKFYEIPNPRELLSVPKTIHRDGYTEPNMKGELIMPDLGDRMKMYENITRTHLLPRTPIIIRVDGKAFHTWTRGMEKPYDKRIKNAFDFVVDHLFGSMQGLRIAYHQSDELSLFLHTWNTFETEQWLGGGVQKIASVAASMVTAWFNRHIDTCAGDLKVADNPALFDARVFTLPKEEVVNYFIWRGRDASRNAINGYAHCKFGQSYCQNKPTAELLNEIPAEEWAQVPPWFQFGTLCTGLGNLSTTAMSRIYDVRQLMQEIVDSQDEA